MDVTLKKNQSFRLSVALIEKLKQLARRENRSLNNYVETLLLDAAYHEPNATTLAAMKEAESGALRDTPSLDMSSIEAMEKSMGDGDDRSVYGNSPKSRARVAAKMAISE